MKTFEQFLREEEDIWYHGAGSHIKKFGGSPLYLTRDEKEATGFAHGLHLGGKGSSPHIHAISAKPGKTINIDTAIEDAMNNDDDLGDRIDKEFIKAKTSGARYVEHLHPSFGGGDDFTARVSLYPHQDLTIKTFKKI